MLDVGRSTFAQRPTLTPALSRRERESRRTAALRRGFTLVEMLVVIFVIVAVTALAIGIASPDTQTRRLRETARQVGAFLQGAKALAAQTGRPVAVIIEPDVGQPLMARTLRYAEVPPPYAGDQLTSMATITSIPPPQPGPPLGSGPTYAKALVSIPNDYPWMTPSDPANDLVRVGDQIRFNTQGSYYPIIAVDPSNRTLTIQPADLSFSNLILLPMNVPMSYQVLRQPTEQAIDPAAGPSPTKQQTGPSAASDLELPESVVIDLVQSGPEGTTFGLDLGIAVAAKPVAILFSPGGGVLHYMANGQLKAASGPLYLMVGKRELVESNLNMLDLQTYWVAVNTQTGLVSTAENSAIRGVDPIQLNESREYVRKALSTGSR